MHPFENFLTVKNRAGKSSNKGKNDRIGAVFKISLRLSFCFYLFFLRRKKGRKKFEIRDKLRNTKSGVETVFTVSSLPDTGIQMYPPAHWDVMHPVPIVANPDFGTDIYTFHNSTSLFILFFLS